LEKGGYVESLTNKNTDWGCEYLRLEPLTLKPCNIDGEKTTGKVGGKEISGKSHSRKGTSVGLLSGGNAYGKNRRLGGEFDSRCLKGQGLREGGRIGHTLLRCPLRPVTSTRGKNGMVIKEVNRCEGTKLIETARNLRGVGLGYEKK